VIETFTDTSNDLFGQFFLFNNEMNNAGDPINFMIYPDNSERIAKSFIGRPYVLPERKDDRWVGAHHRADDLDTLLNKQKRFAAGEIVDVHRNSDTGNYNAIVRFFPEYYDQIRKGDIPEFTSPMFAHTDSYVDQEGKLHIKDGMGIHLQAVPSPGYPPEISGIKSVCEGGLNECMSELKIVAASGNLAEYQSSGRFSKAENGGSQTIMSMQAQQQAPQQAPQGNDLEARVAGLEKGFAEIQKLLQELTAKLSGGQQQPAAPPMAGAAQEASAIAVTEDAAPEKQDVASLSAELAQLKADHLVEKESLEKERATLALQERTRIATEIVENKIKLHRLPIENRDIEIQKLVELKGADEKPADLTLLNDEVKALLKMFVGASGDFAELGIVEDDQTDVNVFRIMEDIG